MVYFVSFTRDLYCGDAKCLCILPGLGLDFIQFLIRSKDQNSDVFPYQSGDSITLTKVVALENPILTFFSQRNFLY